MFKKEMKSIEYVITINSPTKGVVWARVEQRDSYTVRVTFLEGNPAIRTGYGFGMNRAGYVRPGRGAWILAILYRFTMRKHRKTLQPFSREEIYNATKDFVEQLGPSGYLDDGP